MTRIAELEAEIERLRDHQTALDAEAERLSVRVCNGEPGAVELLDATWQAIDDVSDEIGPLRRELDEAEDMASMRENARDRAYGKGITL